MSRFGKYLSCMQKIGAQFKALERQLTEVRFDAFMDRLTRKPQPGDVYRWTSIDGSLSGERQLLATEPHPKGYCQTTVCKVVGCSPRMKMALQRDGGEGPIPCSWNRRIIERGILMGNWVKLPDSARFVPWP